MTVHESLRQIENKSHLELKKSRMTYTDLSSRFRDVCENRDAWLIPCKHQLNPPATEEEIRWAERELGLQFPRSFKEFLLLSNGARLFNVTYDNLIPRAASQHARFEIYGCDGVVRTNKLLLSIFRDTYQDEPEWRKIQQLNYLAFCDAGNGNYQALRVDDRVPNLVFLLFGELLARPYHERDIEWYYTIADGFPEWLELVCKSGGAEGIGEQDDGI